ncbi:hypothetical protein [Daejeonella sp. H1SJ63]|jgi:hypothetical protein|uniref:hypothetical protein n=1 Tax=Daejeonella sp. H1SJ63 TaxID=3034145 RepID=UPI0023EC7B1E|nr:hypothetical protein [Daejeonella sp. H1SJ63]
MKKKLSVFKEIILSAFLFLPLLTVGQNNDFVLAGQIGYSTLSTSSYQTSLMAGIKTENGDQFLVGGLLKRLTEDVGHKQTYVGGSIHAQSDFLGMAPFLSVSFLHGEYYLFNNNSINEVTVKKTIQVYGTVGVGYMLTENLGLFGGYSFTEYNPVKYFKSQTSPYKDGAIKVKLSFNLPFGKFGGGGAGQRRMW